MEQAVCCDYQGQYIQYAGHFKNLTLKHWLTGLPVM